MRSHEQTCTDETTGVVRATSTPLDAIAAAAGLVQLVCFDASDMAYAFPGLVVLLLLELTRQEPFSSGMTWINAIGQGAMNQRTGRTSETAR